MDVSSIVSQINGLDIGVIVVIGLSLVQISPIQLNPWSALSKFIGKSINSDIIKEMDDIKDDIKAIDSKVTSLDNLMEEHSAKDARTRILRFADEILHRVEHTENHYQHIINDITAYKNFCRDHPEFKNDMTSIDIERIEESYKIKYQNRTFL